MDEWMDDRLWVDGWMMDGNKWMDRLWMMDGWMDIWTTGWLNGQMGGWRLKTEVAVRV